MTTAVVNPLVVPDFRKPGSHRDDLRTLNEIYDTLDVRPRPRLQVVKPV